jgi:hypothetical protein
MVVQVVPPPVRETQPRPAEKNGSKIAEHPVLELVGGATSPRRTHGAPEAPELSPDETLRALRLLALDNLLDIVHMRETVAAQQARIEALEREADTWRERALAEGDARHSEALAAHHRERDLISVVHHQMLTVQAMSDELDRRWRRPWRRRARTV